MEPTTTTLFDTRFLRTLGKDEISHLAFLNILNKGSKEDKLSLARIPQLPSQLIDKLISRIAQLETKEANELFAIILLNSNKNTPLSAKQIIKIDTWIDSLANFQLADGFLGAILEQQYCPKNIIHKYANNQNRGYLLFEYCPGAIKQYIDVLIDQKRVYNSNIRISALLRHNLKQEQQRRMLQNIKIQFSSPFSNRIKHVPNLILENIPLWTPSSISIILSEYSQAEDFPFLVSSLLENYKEFTLEQMLLLNELFCNQLNPALRKYWATPNILDEINSRIGKTKEFKQFLKDNKINFVLLGDKKQVLQPLITSFRKNLLGNSQNIVN